MNKSPLQALADLETLRSNDPEYQARRTVWREKYQKEARKAFWVLFAVLLIIQMVVSLVWGHPIARFTANVMIDDITTDAQVRQFGIGLFVGGLFVMAGIARLCTFNDYK